MRPFELLKLLKLFALRTTRYTLHAIFLLTFLSFLILTLALTSQTYAAPQMADYCYLPPFVTDPNTPPNIMIVYEKGQTLRMIGIEVAKSGQYERQLVKKA